MSDNFKIDKGSVNSINRDIGHILTMLPIVLGFSKAVVIGLKKNADGKPEVGVFCEKDTPVDALALVVKSIEALIVAKQKVPEAFTSKDASVQVDIKNLTKKSKGRKNKAKKAVKSIK